MANQESYLKRVHPIRHFVLNLVRNLNVAVPIVPVPCSWVGFGSAKDDHQVLDHLETRLVVLFVSLTPLDLLIGSSVALSDWTISLVLDLDHFDNDLDLGTADFDL